MTTTPNDKMSNRSNDNPPTRRYDIDWLRVIAIWLLLVYHIAIGFQPWGVFFGFIQNDDMLPYLKAPMSMLNVWRIPILFYISGMGVRFAIRKRNGRQLVVERSRRILVPFLFGIVAIVPLHMLLWQQFYHQDLKYVPTPGHLWFLGNIFAYVLLCLPLFLHLKNRPDSKLSQAIQKIMASPWSLVFILAAFLLEVGLVQPDTYEYYAMNLHGFFLGWIAFGFGFLIIHSGDTFWNRILALRWLLLLGAVAFYLMRWWYFDFAGPKYLVAIESNLWIFSIFAFGKKYLNRSSASIRYLTPAAYPVYILHMLFIYLASILIFPLDMAPLLKLVLVSVLTFAGCYAGYEGIRRVRVLRPLFGLK